MASKTELEAVIKLAGNISPSLKAALFDAQRRLGDVGKTSGIMSKAISSAFSFAAKGAAVGAIGIGAGLLAVAKKGLDLASNLQEVQNVVDVTFGANSKNIDAWSKTTLDSYGLAELSAKKYSSTFGALISGSGISGDKLLSMSENLTALTGDFASFHNLKPEEAFEKLKAGISGETEPLKSLGINMNIANLEAFALSKGIKTSYDKMDEASKTMLRYNFILGKSGKEQGEFARTQGSYANQVRLFQERFKDLASTVMIKALPAFTKIMNKGNELIASFANSPDKIKKLQDIIGSVADKVVAFLPTAVSLVSRFIEHLVWGFKVTGEVFGFIRDNLVWIEPLIVGIVGAMAAWKAITVGMAIYKGVMAGIRAGTVAAAFAQWGLNAAVLANPMTWIIVGIAAAVGVLVAGIFLLYKNWDQVQAFLSNSWTNIKQAFAIGINWIVDKINWMIEKMNKIPGIDISLIPKMDTSAYDAATQIQSKGGPASFQKFDTAYQAQSSFAPAVQKFASGGFANRASIFGEAGPEAAIPLKKTPRSLSLLNKTASALGVGGNGSGSPNFSLTVHVEGKGGESVKSQIGEAAGEFFDRCDAWWNSKRRESFG